MTPSFVVNNIVNIRFGNPQFVSQLKRRNFTGTVTASNVANHFIGKFSGTVTFANVVSSLLSHIPVIIGFSTKKQMCRITAYPIITFMTYAETVWNRAVSKFKGHSVSQGDDALGYSKASIIRWPSPKPNPAIVWASRLINLRPKTVNYGDFFNVPTNVWIMPMNIFSSWHCHLTTTAETWFSWRGKGIVALKIMRPFCSRQATATGTKSRGCVTISLHREITPFGVIPWAVHAVPGSFITWILAQIEWMYKILTEQLIAQVQF